MKILFDEIVPKMHVFCATHIGGYIFLRHWGHKIFDHQMGGHKNIAEVLSEIHDPPIPKKMVAPLAGLNDQGFSSKNFRPRSTGATIAIETGCDPEIIM